jgi:hypothetical protein
MSYSKAFLTILAAQALLGAASTSSSSSTSTSTSTANKDGKKFMASTKKDTCKADNDFVHMECGDKKENKQCCDTRSACIEAENKVGEKWEKKFYCSMSRGMTGTKLVKIVMIPMILFIAAILFVVLMVVKLDIKGNHVTKCGVAAIALAWPLFLSEAWIQGLYCCIVALFVSFVSQSPTSMGGLPLRMGDRFVPFPWWVYRLAWAMAAFQVIMFLGPIESFHVPFYSQSLGANTGLENKLLKFTEEACSKHYEDFFTLTTIELNAKGANPDAKYSGLCANGWLNFIQIIQLVQAFLWVATTLVSALAFLTDPTNGVTAKVQPALRAAADATEAPPKAEEKKDEAEEKKDP